MMINKRICRIINKTISQLGCSRVKEIRFRLMTNASDVAHHSLVSVRTVNINGCFSETACKFLISNPCNANSLVPSKYKFNIGKLIDIWKLLRNYHKVFSQKAKTLLKIRLLQNVIKKVCFNRTSWQNDKWRSNIK